MIHNFEASLRRSNEDPRVREAIKELRDQKYPGFICRKSTRAEDRLGVDFWIGTTGVDFKLRKGVFPGDICVETCSTYHGSKEPPWKDELRGQVGWTLDPHKITDVVLYIWLDTWLAYDFPKLRTLALKAWKQNLWGRELAAYNERYTTLCIFPKVALVTEALIAKKNESMLVFQPRLSEI